MKPIISHGVIDGIILVDNLLQSMLLCISFRFIISTCLSSIGHLFYCDISVASEVLNL